MASVALFDCPHCIDEFAFDYQKIASLTYGWRVRVRCPGCGNIVQVVMLAYTVIHGCDPNKYQAGEIVEILPPDLNLSPEWRMAVNTLRMEILQKKWMATRGVAAENHGWMKASRSQTAKGWSRFMRGLSGGLNRTAGIHGRKRKRRS